MFVLFVICALICTSNLDIVNHCAYFCDMATIGARIILAYWLVWNIDESIIFIFCRFKEFKLSIQMCDAPFDKYCSKNGFYINI